MNETTKLDWRKETSGFKSVYVTHNRDTTIIHSKFFDAIGDLIQSEKDGCYAPDTIKDISNENRLNLAGKAQLEYAVMKIRMFQLGMREINRYVNKMHPEKWEIDSTYIKDVGYEKK